MTNTFYWKTLFCPIQGMPGFGGRKPVENVPIIANTWYLVLVLSFPLLMLSRDCLPVIYHMHLPFHDCVEVLHYENLLDLINSILTNNRNIRTLVVSSNDFTTGFHVLRESSASRPVSQQS